MGEFRFGIVNTAAIYDQNVSDRALRVLAAIATYSDKQGWCVVRQSVMAERLGVTRQAISKQVQTLVDTGYLRVEPTFGEDRSQRANRYCVRLDPLDVAPPQPQELHPLQPNGVAPPDTPEVAPRTDLVTRPSKQTLAPASRRRDVLFERVAEVCGWDWRNLTRSGRASLNTAVKDIRPVWSGDEDEIARRAAEYRVRLPNAALTPCALAKWWPSLNGDPTTLPGRNGAVAMALAEIRMEARNG